MFSAVDLSPILFPRGQQGVYVIFALYADDSADQKQKRILTAGAILGFPEYITNAETKWNDRLAKDKIEYFRASDCENLDGPFNPFNRNMSLNSGRALAESAACDLVKILQDSKAVISGAVSLLLDDYREVLNTYPSAQNVWGSDPSVVIYRSLVLATVSFIQKEWPESAGVPISCTFDECLDWKKLEDAIKKLKQDDALCRQRVGYVGHADDRTHAPVQMADLIAYEARYKTLHHLGETSKERLNFQKLANSHSMWFISMLDKNYFVETLRDMGLL